MNKLRDFIKKNILWFIAFFCFVGFLLITIDVIKNEPLKYDTIGYNLISNYLIKDNLTEKVKFITNFGDTIGLISITLIAIILIKNKKIKLLVPINLAVIFLINQILKNILKRTRPIGINIINVSGYSFPSGHSMVSMAFYGYLIYIIYKTVKNKPLKIISMLFLSSLIILIGISRIYLGVHYTSDVLSGFLISIVYLIIFIKITDKYTNINKDD